MTALVALTAVAPDAVEQLLDHAFGPDRRQRTAYRLRDGVAALADMSFALTDRGLLIGTVQCWPVRFTSDAGRVTPLVLVGPVAVLPERQGDGLGKQLMHAALARAEAANLMLIGDPGYYGRFFGFSAARTGGWRLPGPVERSRLLARGPSVPADAGTLGPRITVPA